MVSDHFDLDNVLDGEVFGLCTASRLVDGRVGVAWLKSIGRLWTLGYSLTAAVEPLREG